MAHDAPSEVDRNYDAFVAQLPTIIDDHYGQYALMHRQQIVDYYESALQAITAGFQKFGENGYSVQEVTAESDNLGFYSYAGGTGQA
jgi:hypothetical protein